MLFYLTFDFISWLLCILYFIVSVLLSYLVFFIFLTLLGFMFFMITFILFMVYVAFYMCFILRYISYYFMFYFVLYFVSLQSSKLPSFQLGTAECAERLNKSWAPLHIFLFNKRVPKTHPKKWHLLWNGVPEGIHSRPPGRSKPMAFERIPVGRKSPSDAWPGPPRCSLC